jgi:hypothetical protein
MGETPMGEVFQKIPDECLFGKRSQWRQLRFYVRKSEGNGVEGRKRKKSTREVEK